MRLEHLNLVVEDMDSTLRFYRAAFPHWSVRGGGESEWYGKRRRWLHFGEDHQYLTFNDRGEGRNRNLEAHDVGLAHFAFEVSCLSNLVERMKKSGFEPDKSGQETWRQNVYFLDPSGFEVEFVEYFSDLPDERNQYEG